jgi:hypothetical protein
MYVCMCMYVWMDGDVYVYICMYTRMYVSNNLGYTFTTLTKHAHFY